MEITLEKLRRGTQEYLDALEGRGLSDPPSMFTHATCLT